MELPYFTFIKQIAYSISAVEPEKALIVNVEVEMLYISKQAGPETVDTHKKKYWFNMIMKQI